MALVVLVLVGVLAWMVYAAGRRQAASELDQTALAKSEMHRSAQLEEMSRREHRLNEATVRIACDGAVTPERLANRGDVECLFAAYEAAEGSGWDGLDNARNVAVSEIFNRSREARRSLGLPIPQTDRFDFVCADLAFVALEHRIGARARKKAALVYLSDVDIDGAIEDMIQRMIQRAGMRPDDAVAARAVAGSALRRARAVAWSTQRVLFREANESESVYVKRLEQVAVVGAERVLNDVVALARMTDSEIDGAARTVVAELPGAAIDAMSERVLRGEIVRLVIVAREETRRSEAANQQRRSEATKPIGSNDATAKITKIGWRPGD